MKWRIIGRKRGWGGREKIKLLPEGNNAIVVYKKNKSRSLQTVASRNASFNTISLIRFFIGMVFALQKFTVILYIYLLRISRIASVVYKCHWREFI